MHKPQMTGSDQTIGGVSSSSGKDGWLEEQAGVWRCGQCGTEFDGIANALADFCECGPPRLIAPARVDTTSVRSPQRKSPV
jgi:hypothetical protein